MRPRQNRQTIPLQPIQSIRAVQDTRFDNLRSTERRRVSVQSGATITAEVRDDRTAAVGFLGYRLGRAGDREAFSWDNDICRVC